MWRNDDSSYARAVSVEKLEKLTACLEEYKRDVKDSMMSKWLGKYISKMNSYCGCSSISTGTLLVTIALLLLGTCMQGQWMLIFVFFARRYGFGDNENIASVVSNSSENNDPVLIDCDLKEMLYLQTFLTMAGYGVSITYLIYFTMSGVLHYYYYVRQRNRFKDWKCQPYKWLSPQLEVHAMLMSCLTIAYTSVTTAVLSTYLMHGGPSMVYYNFGEYGWPWFFLQWPVIYLIIDYTAYWYHRFCHNPTWYKWFHKYHHNYKPSIVWAAIAVHPIEIIPIQLYFIAPLFIVPCHLVTYHTIMVYIYYHSILDHTGINFKSHWWQPWQPDVLFHDNHHVYTYVNFGLNTFVWDKLHGTFRPDKIRTSSTGPERECLKQQKKK